MKKEVRICDICKKNMASNFCSICGNDCCSNYESSCSNRVYLFCEKDDYIGCQNCLKVIGGERNRVLSKIIKDIKGFKAFEKEIFKNLEEYVMLKKIENGK